MVHPVALAGVPRVEAQGAASAAEVSLRSGEGAMIPAQPAQEDQRLALAPYFLIEKRAIVHDDLRHGQTGIVVDNRVKLLRPPD
jgi:hypothetical protein